MGMIYMILNRMEKILPLSVRVNISMFLAHIKENGNTSPPSEGKYSYTHPRSTSLRAEYKNTFLRLEGKYFHAHPN